MNQPALDSQSAPRPSAPAVAPSARKMSPQKGRFFRSGHAHADIGKLLLAAGVHGLCLDLPAGKGVNGPGIRLAGCKPIAADLQPEQAAALGDAALAMDFTAPLPFRDGCFDAVLCSEGIEHHPAQQDFVNELARVLRPGGQLLITTPNVLNLRSRLSHMLNGHYSGSRAPITEITGIWGGRGTARPYLGHVHMIGYFELRFILSRAGLVVEKVATAKYGLSSALLAPLLWLPVKWSTGRLMGRYLGEHPDLRREVIRHATCPDLLFGKKLMVLARKRPAGAATS